MVGWVRRACVGALALVGCGPSVASPSGEAGSSDGGETTTAVAATTTREGGTSSSSEASSTGADDSSSSSKMTSSSSGAEPPELLELEGPIHYCGDCFNPMSYLRACGFDEDWLCMVGDDASLMRCNGTYARVRGYLVPNPWFGAIDGACGEHLLEITDVIESRYCEADDCGAGCSEGFDCATTCWGDETCAEGESCKPYGLPEDPFGARRCTPNGTAAVGEPCTGGSATPWEDDCEAGALCFGGTCQALCAEELDFSCAEGHCFYGGSTTVCLPACNPLEPDCLEGESCMASNASFACLDPAQAEVFAHSDCAGTTCGPLERCLDAEAVPGCSEDACCSPLCDATMSECADGLTCLDLWSDDEYPELANLGVCADPGA